MRDPHPDRIEPEDAAHLDQLLESLKRLEMHGPSPFLRSKLAELFAQRSKEETITQHTNSEWNRIAVLRLRYAAAMGVVMAVLLAAAVLINRQQRQHVQTAIQFHEPSPQKSSSSGDRATAAAPAPKPARLSVHRLRPAPANTATPGKMTVSLPYSNSAIATGTGMTVRVSMSQFELASLGFPVQEGLLDRRVVAELTLGDDGLLRAISVPLPLKVIKEKK